MKAPSTSTSTLMMKAEAEEEHEIDQLLEATTLRVHLEIRTVTAGFLGTVLRSSLYPDNRRLWRHPR